MLYNRYPTQFPSPTTGFRTVLPSPRRTDKTLVSFYVSWLLLISLRSFEILRVSVFSPVFPFTPIFLLMSLPLVIR